MTNGSFFEKVPEGQEDPVMVVINKFIADQDPRKVDLSIGVYKPENGDGKYVFPSVKKAKEQIYLHDEGHPYHQMLGLPSFIKGARETVFGEERATQGKIASLQSISGTGAIHMGIEVVKQLGLLHFYVGNPTWGNYESMIESQGCKVTYFNHYNKETGTADGEAVLQTIDSMADGTVLLLQACCHNPTGADYTKEEWKQICQKLKSRNIFVFFDIAYQGFASGDKDEDAWAIRHFYDAGLEFLACESFSKNMGIYGERTGCLHVVGNSNIENVQTLMTSIFRSQCSFGPLFGARIASYLFNDFKQQWDEDVKAVSDRMIELRQKVFNKLEELQTPGKWDAVIKQHGLFWYSGLNPEQVEELTEKYHVYIPGNGRFNVAALNNDNLDYVVESIDKVVRSSK